MGNGLVPEPRRKKHCACADPETVGVGGRARGRISDGARKIYRQTTTDSLRVYARAGGEILFGTDVGYVTDYDTTDEYVLMSGAGMTFQQILAALTVSPAKRFGMANHTGRIAVGMDADIVILNGDPAVDIKAFSNIRFTLRKGKILYERKRP